MLCFNPFDKLYKLIRLCNRKTRFLLFLADNEHHVFFRGALIVQVLNVVMEMPANCVWHTVFEWKTVIFVLMSHNYFYVYSYECSMADFFSSCCGGCHNEGSWNPCRRQSIHSQEKKMNSFVDYPGRHINVPYALH